MNESSKTGFLERTLRNVRNAWQGIAGAAYDESAASMQPDLPDDDAARLSEQMHACLETRGGEVSARARAAALGRAYMALNKTGRERFLGVMANELDVDHDAVAKDAAALSGAGDDGERNRAEAILRKSLIAPRVKLLTQFNALPEGVKFLVDMRADLLGPAKRDTALKGLERDLKDLLKTWFDVDFLELRRITWDTASASLLEKLIAYEAVHAIESWDDLKNRLDSDRRCFAYFHPRMPDEPLIFVEVALVDGLSGSVQALLDADAPVIDPAGANTAIFYSISNAQKGLAGISFGHFLIKRVVAMLSEEFKGLKTFSTLSPVPGFKDWLDKYLVADDEAGLLKPVNEAGWAEDDAKSDALRDPLLRLCARYLSQEKHSGDAERALNPVAHFHLSNGARMERLNWLGDTSDNGLGQGAGLMINYLYKLDDIEKNHEAYTSTGKVAMSSGFKSLLKG